MLLETLETVFAQTWRDLEVVVVNDGSTDDTAERFRPLAEGGRIRLINQANAGIGAARNRGIDESQGRYVALLDHDDLWKPGKLQAQVEFMESHKDCAACTVRWSTTQAPTRESCDFSGIIDASGCVIRPLHQLARGRVFLISSSILFDREKAHGLRYMTERRCIEDTPFQVKLFSLGAFGVAGGEILMVYRVHETNYSSQADFFSNGIRMLRRLDRSAEFQALAGQDRGDMMDFFAHVGRTAWARQALEGHRLQALKVYAGEFGHQVAQRNWKFLVGAPMMTMMPRRMIHRTLGAAQGKTHG
jgi:glycosyltransferase involved in cell wall biosynthesis